MHTIHQGLEQPRRDHRVEAHPALRGFVEDQAIAYAEEVRVLRQRVAMLESELAAAKLAQTHAAATTASSSTAIDFARRPTPASVCGSEFTEQTTPAVVTVVSANAPAVHAPVPAAAEEASEPGFARAWSAEDPVASFEERVAERAFFQASTIDEESRSWLLAQ